MKKVHYLVEAFESIIFGRSIHDSVVKCISFGRGVYNVVVMSIIFGRGAHDEIKKPIIMLKWKSPLFLVEAFMMVRYFCERCSCLDKYVYYFYSAFLLKFIISVEYFMVGWETPLFLVETLGCLYLGFWLDNRYTQNTNSFGGLRNH